MKWISILVRKPEESGAYFWRGKRCGGYSFWNGETFEFPMYVAYNHVADEHVYWLDETDAMWEELC